MICIFTLILPNPQPPFKPCKVKGDQSREGNVVEDEAEHRGNIKDRKIPPTGVDLGVRRKQEPKAQKNQDAGCVQPDEFEYPRGDNRQFLEFFFEHRIESEKQIEQRGRLLREQKKRESRRYCPDRPRIPAPQFDDGVNAEKGRQSRNREVDRIQKRAERENYDAERRKQGADGQAFGSALHLTPFHISSRE